MAERRFNVGTELDYSNGAQVALEIESLLSGAEDDLVLDCQDLQFIDSFGIALFVRVKAQLARQGHNLRLENVPPMLGRRLGILGLDDHLGSGELDPT